MMRFIYILVFFILSGCVLSQTKNYDAIVDQQGISPESYKSLQAALDAIPTHTSSKKPYRIYIKSGNYYEKIIIAKPNIELIGEDKHNTRIYYDAYAGQQATDPGSTPGQIWGTTGSATMIVRATDISIRQLTIENTFDFLANDARAEDDPKRIKYTQAVALHLDKGSDRFLVKDSQLLGYQDTLFVNSGRSWFDRVLVAGNIDFIFGKGNAIFTNSEIKTLPRGKPNFPHAYLVAPSTDLNNNFGLTFINCQLTREQSVRDNSTPLGRPWHPTTQFADGRYADPNAIGKAVFINCWMDAHIAQEGWTSMSGTTKDGNKISFMPKDSRFFEYKSQGSGTQINKKRQQLSDSEAMQYTLEKVFGDWTPTRN